MMIVVAQGLPAVKASLSGQYDGHGKQVQPQDLLQLIRVSYNSMLLKALG